MDPVPVFHVISVSPRRAREVFFQEQQGGRTGGSSYMPRAVFCDTDPSPLEVTAGAAGQHPHPCDEVQSI